jgi:UDP-glucose 4-epimerase
VTQCGDLIQISKTWPPHSVRDPFGYYRNNTVNSRALIETATECGVGNCIFSSTAAVYRNPAVPVPTAEVALRWSKLMTEMMRRDASASSGLMDAGKVRRALY